MTKVLLTLRVLKWLTQLVLHAHLYRVQLCFRGIYFVNSFSRSYNFFGQYCTNILVPFLCSVIERPFSFFFLSLNGCKNNNSSCFQKQFPMVKFSGEWLGIPHWHFLHIKFKKDQACTNLWFVCQEHDLLSSSLCTILVPVHCKKTKLHCVLTLIFEPVTSRFIQFFLTNFFLPCFGSW